MTDRTNDMHGSQFGYKNMAIVQESGEERPPVNPSDDPFAALREQMREALDEVLVRCIPKCTEYALLDYPNHANVGDSSIWLGELRYLNSKLNKAPRYMCHLRNFASDDLRRVLKDGTIFLHGGGNFGDWYPQHQEFRERVIANYKQHPIIQLPQTIDYREKRNLERFRQIAGKHKNLTILVRDTRSYELAVKNFDCHVYLCPDMAFELGSLKRAPAKVDCLWLLRTDHEASGPERNPERFLENLRLDTSLRRHEIVDWLPPRRNRWLRAHDNFERLLQNLPNAVKRASLRSRSYVYEDMARRRVKRGAKLLSTSRYVVTDRLHGHIFCVLLGIPHVCIDNAYGKVSSFFETWSESCPQASYADSIETAVDKLRVLSST